MNQIHLYRSRIAKKTMIIIENDDEIYLSWIQANPEGFVVNTTQSLSTKGAMLHRATCSHISTPERSNWTTTGYVKICSTIIAELEQWASESMGQLNSCGTCKPNVPTDPSQGIPSAATPSLLPFKTYPKQGRELLGRRSVTNSRRGYGLALRKLTNQTCCVYCGIDIYATYENWLLLQVDHVIPTTMGKRLGIQADWLEDYSNLVLACSGCNTFANQFNPKEITEAPKSLEEFYQLRDRVFLARFPIIQECQRKEREFFDSMPWNI